MKINKKLQLVIAKRIIKDKEYRINRMKLMSDTLIYWENRETNISNTFIEKRYCKNMKEMYFKRFLWYKNYYNT